MKALVFITLVSLLMATSACKQKAGKVLPDAESGNLPAGADASDEMPLQPSSVSYVQPDSSSTIEYVGSSN